MSEYDYSPDAYRRHMENQARIARWVDNTQRSAKDFRSPFVPPSDAPRKPSPLNLRSSDDEDEDVLPSQSISQYNPSPPPGHHHHHQGHGHGHGHGHAYAYGSGQGGAGGGYFTATAYPPQSYPSYPVAGAPGYPIYPQQHMSHITSPGGVPLPGPTPFAVQARHRSPPSSRHSRSPSSSRRSSKKSRSPTYVVSPTMPGPMPSYGAGAPGSLMALSPPVTPGIPGMGVQQPFMVLPQGKRVQVLYTAPPRY